MENEPKVTHYGTWVLDKEKDIKIECYVMDNEEREGYYYRSKDCEE